MLASVRCEQARRRVAAAGRTGSDEPRMSNKEQVDCIAARSEFLRNVAQLCPFAVTYHRQARYQSVAGEAEGSLIAKHAVQVVQECRDGRTALSGFSVERASE